jgi:hypothetical protein
MTFHDPFGRSRLPDDFSREGRVALLKEGFEALMRGELPSLEARLFLAGGGVSWLSEGGDLARDYWRVSAPRGSHRRPEVLARELDVMGDERQDGSVATD